MRWLCRHRTDVLTRYGGLVVGRMSDAAEGAHASKELGQMSDVPFAEIPALAGLSPFFTDSHRAFLRGVRAFVQTELEPIAASSDRSGAYPERELIMTLCKAGMYVGRLGPGPWMEAAEALGIRMPGGLALRDFDYFHEMIVHQEIGRIGLPGFIDSLGASVLSDTNFIRLL